MQRAENTQNTSLQHINEQNRQELVAGFDSAKPSATPMALQDNHQEQDAFAIQSVWSSERFSEIVPDWSSTIRHGQQNAQGADTPGRPWYWK
ncbi:MAG: hypothetical protein CMJ70_27420 [Planctomycetaceae bacterium]|nr:hypothetical protein [Planctomycetaceae bacterium]HAA67718.1 hypothetical protein [Planctomycetaceae bacterium]